MRRVKSQKQEGTKMTWKQITMNLDDSRVHKSKSRGIFSRANLNMLFGLYLLAWGTMERHEHESSTVRVILGRRMDVSVLHRMV